MENTVTMINWSQALTIIGVNIALLAALAGLIIWAVSKLDSDIKTIATRLDGHAARIDQLYHIIIDLIKEGRK
jgi:hypothetical protein